MKNKSFINSIFNLKITPRIVLTFLLVSLGGITVVSILFYNTQKQILIERTTAQLSSVNTLKKSSIERYFQQRKKFVEDISKSEKLHMLADSSALLKHLGFEHAYFLKNIGEKKFDLHDGVEDAALKKLIMEKGAHAYCVYEMTDDSLYILTAIPFKTDTSKDGGILILKDYPDELSEILTERTGLGKTGETYIIGSDQKMRSQSRFFPDSFPLHIIVNTEASKNVFAGKEVFKPIRDYRNMEVLSVYRQLEIQGLKWAIISEIDMEEVLAPVHRLRDTIIQITLLIGIIICVISFLLAIRITKPVKKFHKVITHLSKGKLTEEKLQIDRNDELGDIAKSLNQLTDNFSTTAAFAQEIGNGNFEKTYELLSEDDILGKALINMRDKLRAAQLREKEFLRQRTSALIEGQENERKRISRELHDGIGQLITAIKFRTGVIEGQEDLKRELMDLLREAVEEIRRISQNLMPSVLLDFGLESGLRILVKKISDDLGIKINYTFEKSDDAEELTFEYNVALYRILQEALNNIAKYSEATEVVVYVNHKKDNLQMLINDNGKGFDLQEALKRGKGLGNMKERATILNGTTSITSYPGKGTKILVDIPL